MIVHKSWYKDTKKNQLLKYGNKNFFRNYIFYSDGTNNPINSISLNIR